MKPEKIELDVPTRLRDIPGFFLIKLPRAIVAIRAAMRESHCGKKIGHASIGDAQAHADRLTARPGSPAFHPYRCRYCNKFHVGREAGGL